MIAFSHQKTNTQIHLYTNTHQVLMPKFNFIILLLLFLVPNFASAQMDSLSTYPWMLSYKWSVYEGDNWYSKITVADLVKEDYSNFFLHDRWKTKEDVTIKSAEVTITRLDRKTKKRKTQLFHIQSNDLSSILPEIEKCGSAEDTIRFDKMVVEVQGQQYLVSGYFMFVF